MTDNAIEFERRIEAPPSAVFKYLVEADLWMKWQGTEATIDARPGGVHRVNIRGDAFASGTIVEVIPDRRIAFTWGFEIEDHPVPRGSTLIEMELVPDGDATILRFRQTAVPEGFDAVAQGWRHYLDRLQVAAAGQDPGPDPTLVSA